MTMPPRASRSRNVGLGTAVFAALAVACIEPSVAEAQPCCAGSSALTPARLALHEGSLVGLQMRATGIVGSFDDRRRFLVAPSSTREVDLEQDLIVTVRFLHRAQASFTTPFEETYRKVPGLSEWGGGVGDVALALRYDFFEAGASKRIPGIALLGALTFPTGLAPESASKLLATDSTGTGSFQAALGASFEQSFGRVLLDLTGSATWRAPRNVDSIHTQDGGLFVASAAFAYSFDPGPVMALSVAYSAALATSINDMPTPNGGKATTRVGLSGGREINDHWRAQGVFFSDLPVRYLGDNQPVGVGGSFILIRSWL